MKFYKSGVHMSDPRPDAKWTLFFADPLYYKALFSQYSLLHM